MPGALLVNFLDNWITLSSHANFTHRKTAKQTKSFGSFLSELKVSRLNKFCPSFHNLLCSSAASFTHRFKKKLF